MSRFPTFDLLPKLSVLPLAAALLLPAQDAAAARIDGVEIVRVRAYLDDGNAHIDLSTPISPACGGRLRVPARKGQDKVLDIALAALLAGAKVTVESQDARSGNFCNLTFIWIHRP